MAPAEMLRRTMLVLAMASGLAVDPRIVAAAGDEAKRNLEVQAAAPAVRQEQRLALVIGNSAYKEAPLTNPVNDARAMAQALQAAGFTVMLHTDVDHRALIGAVREFGNGLRKGGVGIFYFAGHGMQIKGRNYLIPVGADIQREDEVAYSGLDAQAVLDKMEAAANGANLMILDACRNNPFARNFRSSVQGLAQMEAPVGTLVAFS
ncbi:MAG TPA: caspase family protein, partial [Ramlibacter sp.]|nr:caspase family protein [Ramlibacter sp.]